MKLRIGRITTARILVLLGVVTGTVIVATFLSSCYTRRDGRDPLHVAGVPVIRVRVMSGPVGSVTISTTGPCVIRCDGRVAGRSGALRGARVSLQGGLWSIGSHRASGSHVEIVPEDGGRVTLGKIEYRGWIRLVASGGGFYAVNHVDVESYLTGVLAEELYGHWSDQTYQAQALAARTFAMYKIETFGRADGSEYDLTNTQGSQVYGGVLAETDKAWRAVRSTHGKVLVYGPPGGKAELILAHYSACCGGTVNTVRVLRSARDIPPLRGGQRCNDCSASSRFSWPPVTVSKRELFRCLSAAYEKVAALGSLAAIRVSSRAPYGLPLWVQIVSPSGRTVRVRYNDIRSALQRGRSPAAAKLHSMNCRMKDHGSSIEFYDGHGFGHGVGLCQWGAEGKAQRNWSASRIVKFYYPGITIHQAYGPAGAAVIFQGKPENLARFSGRASIVTRPQCEPQRPQDAAAG